MREQHSLNISIMIYFKGYALCLRKHLIDISPFVETVFITDNNYTASLCSRLLCCVSVILSFKIKRVIHRTISSYSSNSFRNSILWVLGAALYQFTFFVSL